MEKNNSDFLRNVLSHLTNQSNLTKLTADVISFLAKVFVCVLLYYLVLKFIKKLTPFYKKNLETHSPDNALKSFATSILRIGLHAALITVCLLILGIKESSLIAFFGTLGIGVGLALKDNLSNLAAGVIILLFKTYQVGDSVKIADNTGYVYDIDIFYTTINTFNGNLVMLPNGSIITNKVINYSKTPLRRIDIAVGVGYETDIAYVINLLENYLKENSCVLKDKKIYVNVTSYGNSSINLALKAWTLNKDYWKTYYDLLNGVKSVLYKENISMPFSQMDVHLNVIDKKTKDNK